MTENESCLGWWGETESQVLFTFPPIACWFSHVKETFTCMLSLKTVVYLSLARPRSGGGHVVTGSGGSCICAHTCWLLFNKKHHRFLQQHAHKDTNSNSNYWALWIFSWWGGGGTLWSGCQLLRLQTVRHTRGITSCLQCKMILPEQ